MTGCPKNSEGMSEMLAFGITQTRKANPVLGSGSARIDTAPLGALMRERSCFAMSVGVMRFNNCAPLQG